MLVSDKKRMCGMNASKSSLVAGSLLMLSTLAAAEMKSLSDDDLSGIDGQGIGIVLDDFAFSHEHNPSEGKIFKINGITNSAGQAVTINVNQLYIARANSNYGTNIEGVNLGRLTNPYEIDVIDGDDPDIGLPGEAVLQFAAPKKVENIADGFDCLSPTATKGTGLCSSRPANTVVDSGATWVNGERPDMGLELEIVDGANTSNVNFNVQSAVFDGSYLRLWGDDANGRMAAEFRLNFYTPQLEISTCDKTNQGCSSSIKMSDFQLELALGNTFQPLYMGVNTVTGGLTLEIEKITHQYIDRIDTSTGHSDGSTQGNEAEAFFLDYYTNQDYRSDIVIGNMDIGGTDLGSSKIEGILIQYMDVKFRDLK